MIKKLIVIPLLLLTTFSLSSCGETEGAESESGNAPHTHYTFWQVTPTGRVLCVWAKSGYGGGLSCDWANQEK